MITFRQRELHVLFVPRRAPAYGKLLPMVKVSIPDDYCIIPT